MTTGQKAIKYLAICLAIGIIFSIIGGIVSFFGFITYDNDDYLKEMESFDTEFSNIQNLDIDIKAAELVIEIGEEFDVSTNNKYVRVSEKNNVLKIEERKHQTILGDNKSKVIITIPKNYNFLDVSLDTGVGLVDISELITNKMDLDVGVGDVKITNLQVLKEASIDGGVGKININDSEINNLDLDIGVGDVTLYGKILGRSEFDCGTGSLELNILDSKENYTLYLSKGLGSININNENIANNSTIGNGFNYLNIEGGLGSIDVNFNN